MEVRLLSKEDKSIRVEVIDENETLLNVLKERLLQDPDVDVASFIVGHPLLDQPQFVLRMRKGKPEAALRGATKVVRDELDKFETDFLKLARDA